MRDEIAVLKWAAGAPILLPNEPRIGAETLLRLVEAHNLSGRFLHRIRECRVEWLSHDLMQGLKEIHQEVKRQVARNIAALSELRRQLPEETRIIMIKGISAYALCDQDHIMRAGDIDLFSNNPSVVVETLLSEGYYQTRAPFMHELGEYSRGTTEFDIHEYFPVYGYSPALQNASLLPAHNAGRWQQSYQLQHTRITFEDLERHAQCGNQPATRDVRITDPNLQAIIICAHAFMNYTNMWSISHREKACVRLGELNDLFSLAAHPSFTKERFLAYVARYQAKDAVEWAACMALSVFGKSPLPMPSSISLGDPLPLGRFPRCLWWNFWSEVPSKPDDLLTTRWLSMDWLANQLGTNPVTVGGRQAATMPSTEGAACLARCITQHAEPIPITFQARRAEWGVEAHLRVQWTSPADLERVRIDLGDRATELIYDARENRRTTVGFPIISDFVCSGTEYQLTLRFSWGHPDTKKSIPMLIGVARQTDVGELSDSTLIPVALGVE